MANKKVEIKVNAYAGDSIFMCGNIKQLGSWDPKGAVELKKVESGRYAVTKMLPESQIIEFKFLAEKDWATVEKGMYDEELDNHIICLPVDEELVFTVDKFNKK